MTTELKEIPIDKILANFTQPREKFDKEKIKELAESILGNGLINPITVREYKGGRFMIVAGERRWQSHKIAKLKTIQAFVKEYKNDGEWMVESLIENIHREDLAPLEKARYLKRIKDIENIESYQKLGNRVKMNESIIKMLFNLLPIESEIKKSKVDMSTKDYKTLSDISTLKDKKDREILLNKISREEIGVAETRKIIPIIKKAPTEVKEALLDDKINVEQAERISKLKTEPQRQKAIQEHKNISKVEKNVEKNIVHQQTAKEKREFEKRLVQVNNMILSFKNSVTDVRISLEKSLKILLVNTRLVEVMDERQKEKFDIQLDRLVESLERGEHIAEQIKDKL